MQEDKQLIDNEADIELNPNSKARFLFLLGFFGFFLFCAGCCYNLLTHKYKSTATMEIPKSSQYDPQYK